MTKLVTQEDKAKINQRINRFGKQGGFESNKKKKLSIDTLVKSVVRNYGILCVCALLTVHVCVHVQTSCNVDDQIYWQDSSVEGTSEALEKRYLRLTSVRSCKYTLSEI